jgi:type 2 lantibiotic biosynthesis protein LanM
MRKVLRGVEVTSNDHLPSWASTFKAIFYSQRKLPLDSELLDIEERLYDAEHPLPFQEVVVNLVLYALEHVRSESSSAIEVLRPSAVTTLQRQLLAHLTFVANLTIGQNFYQFRFQRAPASALEFAWQQQVPSTEIYSDYVNHMRAGGFRELLHEYPVLARLLCESIEQWIRTTSQFCLRFEHDFAQLKAFFRWKVERPFGAITQLRTNLSDRHQGGQTVIECILHSGERVFYKPRSLQPEIAFYRFVEWLNKRGLAYDLKVLRTLDRATHGWIESVEHKSCQIITQVENFYTRAGMLLAVLHVLGVTDIHCENLIASGEYPVIVDLETLVNGGFSAPAPKFSVGKTEDYLQNDPSILNIGLLPVQYTSLHGQKFDMSALGSDGTQDPDIKVLSWHAINTDQMKLSEAEKYKAPLTHRVRLDDQLPSVSDYLPAFLSGFQETYFRLLEDRSVLLADAGLLTTFDNLDLRILVRGTSTYTRLHLYLFHPEFLKDGIDRSIELEWLARPLSGPVAPSQGRQLLYECERIAMENLDIPRLSTSLWKRIEFTASDEDLWLLHGERDSRVIRQRLDSLSPQDYQRQLEIIEESIKSRFQLN